MTARDCVIAAILHREPERIPVDLGSTPSSGISLGAYIDLKRYLGLPEADVKVYDVVQMLAEPEDELLDRFGVSVIDIGRSFNRNAEEWYRFDGFSGYTFSYPTFFRPRRGNDGSWCTYDDDGVRIAVKASGATFFDQAVFPYLDGYPADFNNLSNAMSRVVWQRYAHSPWHLAERPGFWDELRRKTLELRRNTDRALVISCGCNLFEWGTFLRRMDNFLMDLMIDRVNVEALLDALMEIHLDTLEHVCRSVGDIVDVIRLGDDLGTNDGPFFSPSLYRELFKPRHTALCDYIRKNSRMHTFLHSCGSISALIPDIIGAGFEIINPVQTDARDMEPAMLKREFGNDVTFWGGGVDTRRILATGTPQEVRDCVRRRIDIFAPGGGFVFNTIHNILPDVPAQNIIAMFETLREEG